MTFKKLKVLKKWHVIHMSTLTVLTLAFEVTKNTWLYQRQKHDNTAWLYGANNLRLHVLQCMSVLIINYIRTK